MIDFTLKGKLEVPADSVGAISMSHSTQNLKHHEDLDLHSDLS